MSEIAPLPTVACLHCRLPVTLVARPAWGNCWHCNGSIKVTTTGTAQAHGGPRSRPMQSEHLLDTTVSLGTQGPNGLVYAGLCWQSEEDGQSEEWLTVTADGSQGHSLESGGLYIGNRWQHYEILEADEVRSEGAERVARGVRFRRDGEGLSLYWLRGIRGLVPIERRVGEMLKVEWFTGRRGRDEICLGFTRDGARSYWQWLEAAPRPQSARRRALASSLSEPVSRHLARPEPPSEHFNNIGSLAVVVLLAVAALLSILALINHRLLYQSPTILLEEQKDWLSEPFKIEGYAGHVEVTMQAAGMDNQWVEALLCLVNQKTAERRCLTLENWQYSGVDSGYHWQEGKLFDNGYFNRMRAGEYRLEAHGFSNAPHPNYRLSLVQASSRYRYLGIALWLITLPMALRALVQMGLNTEEQQSLWLVVIGLYGWALWGLW